MTLKNLDLLYEGLSDECLKQTIYKISEQIDELFESRGDQDAYFGFREHLKAAYNEKDKRDTLSLDNK